MTQKKRLFPAWAPAVLAAFLLSACSPQGIAIGAGAAVGRVLLQERDASDALSDADIEIGIVSRILEFSPEAAASVSVTVIEGRVLIVGDVDRAEDVARIVEIAWMSPDVVSVANELTVGLGGGLAQASADLQLAAAIRFRLVRDPGVADINYSVSVDGGIVHIAGLARDGEELRKVVWHARRTAGVVQVVSHVLTVDDPRRTAPARAPRNA